jgi:hypothetical protein
MRQIRGRYNGPAYLEIWMHLRVGSMPSCKPLSVKMKLVRPEMRKLDVIFFFRTVAKILLIRKLFNRLEEK